MTAGGPQNFRSRACGEIRAIAPRTVVSFLPDRTWSCSGEPGNQECNFINLNVEPNVTPTSQNFMIEMLDIALRSVKKLSTKEYQHLRQGSFAKLRTKETW